MSEHIVYLLCVEAHAIIHLMDVAVDPWLREVRAHLQCFLLSLHHASVLLRVDAIGSGPKIESDTVILLLSLLQLLTQLHSLG